MNRCDARRGLWFAAVLVVLSAPTPRPAAAQSGDAFLCYRGRTAPHTTRFAGATTALTDERQTRTLELRRPRLLCAPVDLGSGLLDADTHLIGYSARPADPVPYLAETNVQVLNRLGELYVDRQAAPELLLAPAAIDASVPPSPPDPLGGSLDHYRCHRAAPHGAAGLAAGQQVTVQHPSGPVVYGLKHLRHLCDPVDAAGQPLKHAAESLACYTAKRARGQGARTIERGLHAADLFGPSRLDALGEREICLPSRAIARCNGAQALCDRRYDAVSYPTTHNAMSNAEDGFLLPNQQLSVPHQLADGVRGLMLDTWYFEGATVLCHGGDIFPCNVSGMKPLADGLAQIKTFLDQHPSEVVSIIFESYISEADTLAAFIASGALGYTHVQAAADPWPTLRQLIAADTRLVVFTDRSESVLPWHHYVWDYAWETHYSFETPADFSCARNRGSAGNSLFILNHFLTQLVGSPALAEQVNHNPLFVDRAEQCEAEGGQLPNFVTVDHYQIGDLFAVVDQLNGLAP
ncbi:MAG: hypothetical protein SF182_29580 [Deltaproteobacteria bacterium]|nr:hypothetical protein [Deltaproteobacteria bacterium]